MGTYSVHLVGESKFQDAIDLLVRGERISLIHEPDNRYDKAAVKAVGSEGSTIGENGGEKVDHGSGGMSPLRAA